MYLWISHPPTANEIPPSSPSEKEIEMSDVLKPEILGSVPRVNTIHILSA